MGLERYRQMRDFARTPEPSGKVSKRKGWSFVVQKHAASRLHYDFRLELDGVLKSWSIPKGPTYDTREKRLAVQVEDHPIEYGRFEGIIPEGEYGGGTVMLWDRGRWEPVGDPHDGLAKGHLELELHGERLRGRWTMVRLRPRAEDRGKASWLFFKRTDEHANPESEITETAITSVTTGRSMDEIASATGRARKVWHSGRESVGGGTMRARIRAAAREGRAKRVRPVAKEIAGEPAAKKIDAPARARAKPAARKWSVAPRESAYRGPSARRTGARDSVERVKVGGVSISNPQRVIDPVSGLTKLDLARYYEAIASAFLEHASGRPLALVRCPEGAAGQCFFQKHSHPGMAKTIDVDVDPHGEELLSVTTADGVISLAQWGAVEVHGWGSRVSTLERPDWIVMDLDPAEDVGWGAVVEAAEELRARLTSLGLVSFVKTTGGKGLHVVVPLSRRQGWDAVKDFAHGLALEMVERDPARFVATMSKRARAGKIFVDYLRNVRGSTAILPYSARARDGLPVAMPIAWAELRRVDPGAFTVKTVPALLAKRRRDPWGELWSTRQSITKAVLSRSKKR